MEKAIKILYPIAGFVYALVMYSATLNIIHYFDFPEENFPIATKAIFWGFHLLIPAFAIAVLDKFRILMEYDEDTNIVNVLLESIAWIFPSSFRCFAWGAVIIVINLIMRHTVEMHFIEPVLNDWPFDMTVPDLIFNPAY